MKKSSKQRNKPGKKNRARRIFEESCMKATPQNRKWMTEQMKNFGRGEHV